MIDSFLHHLNNRYIVLPPPFLPLTISLLHKPLLPNLPIAALELIHNPLLEVRLKRGYCDITSLGLVYVVFCNAPTKQAILGCQSKLQWLCHELCCLLKRYLEETSCLV